jgi:hypothetical protein
MRRKEKGKEKKARVTGSGEVRGTQNEYQGTGLCVAVAKRLCVGALERDKASSR